jgi:cob(I)alamin adenosyltransferase
MTSLFGGTKLPKSHPRFHAYGTIDELNVYFGLMLSQLLPGKVLSLERILSRIQHELFIAGGVLACDDSKWLNKIPRLSEDMITQLEHEIDIWNESLPALKNFILPSGVPVALSAHMARTICRRAERWTLTVIEVTGSDFFEDYQKVLKYLNRLSDHLFTLSRWLNYQNGFTETPWIP